MKVADKQTDRQTDTQTRQLAIRAA